MLIEWYQENKRDLPWRHTKDAYAIWISEIMLQQTRVEAVKEYYRRFLEVAPTLEDLATCDADTLLKLWEGLGYYSRVRNMQKCAQILVEGGNKTLPSTYEELIQLPGIGSYTAGAILSIAYEKPCVAIDGNVYRVMGRYYGISASISKASTYSLYKEYIEKIYPSSHFGDFTQSFMDLGSLICTVKNPECSLCPLSNKCLAYKRGETHLYPVKDKKKEKNIEERNVYVCICKGKVGIVKRPSTGLLASLYEFPNSTELLSCIDIENALLEKNIAYSSVIEIGESKHVFSHIIWYMKGFILLLEEEIEGLLWVSKKELQDIYSLPSAFRYFEQKFLEGDWNE